jgi:hypothetical protein
MAHLHHPDWLLKKLRPPGWAPVFTMLPGSADEIHQNSSIGAPTQLQMWDSAHAQPVAH